MSLNKWVERSGMAIFLSGYVWFVLHYITGGEFSYDFISEPFDNRHYASLGIPISIFVGLILVGLAQRRYKN